MTTMADTFAKVGRTLRSPYAPLIAFVLIGVISVLGFYRADRNSDLIRQAACDGARDTREVIVDILTFTGNQQLDPDDYTNPELAQAIERSNRHAAVFRNSKIGELERPPPQCAEFPAQPD